ncbi:MAG: hemerythrin domain-containing protein [Prolixibacteraceae bacterium]|nr:hemerythrin domain-containing protein [Prolixibacteraceae bacterium]
MVRATQNLENDHQHILKLIEVMEAMVKQQEPTMSHLEEVVTLIRQFADGLHHAKEETLLFPLMAEKGFSMQQGPVAVMLMDHDQGRTFVKGMSENIQLYRNGTKEAMAQVYQNMLGYTELLTNHIAKENNILFRMADNILTMENQQSLLDQFQWIDNGSENGISASDFIVRIEILANIYLTTN